MNLAVHVAADDIGRLPVSRARLADVVRLTLRSEGVRQAMISVALISRRAIAKMNREHLGHAGPTDVISFGFAPEGGDGAVVGDVYVCPDVARENARAHRAGVREELVRLVIHGTLHVLGHEHPTDEERETSAMWRRQERLVARALRGAA
jgi:probable rRNA maturation factor